MPLNLDRAIDAGADGIGYGNNANDMRHMSAVCIRSAMPHILTALTEQAREDGNQDAHKWLEAKLRELWAETDPVERQRYHHERGSADAHHN